MSQQDTDIANMLQSAGEPVTLRHDAMETSVYAIFDAVENQRDRSVGGGSRHQEQLTLSTADADLAAIAAGDTVTVRSATYRIDSRLDDGEGLTTLQLRKVSA